MFPNGSLSLAKLKSQEQTVQTCLSISVHLIVDLLSSTFFLVVSIALDEIDVADFIKGAAVMFCYRSSRMRCKSASLNDERLRLRL